ncbi:protein phosphatase 2C ABI1 [Emericellopsis atlantica]|uniref:Protein phosphatase 2C ABI1 n=1 Tax=Emericellopsis atlantica TaxID=2614577 RepID=A0A9P7ZIE7_9HYPO|nr:protein phosphatase 2C ABI1 [Emericellopsis atlantica]KAG9252610.1 protein phosphatase 2C ABI1 [Emericellopsis atlantica]
MFGGNSHSSDKTNNPAQTSGADSDSTSIDSKKSSSPDASPVDAPEKTTDQISGEKRSGNGSPPGRSDNGSSGDKKRRSSGVSSKASSLLASAKNTLSFSQSRNNVDLSAQSPIQKLGKQDPALAVPQGSHNNSAGESVPGPKSTFRVGVWEDRNKKCRRTMEDTHAFLYNFLSTPATVADVPTTEQSEEASTDDMAESDNGYFAIFDGHAGTFAADWCGKKLHLLLEDIVRKYPYMPMPELLDQTFTAVDAQLEKLPVKNSGCTAAIAVLRWEDRVPNERSATGSQHIAPAVAAVSKKTDEERQSEMEKETSEVSLAPPTEAAHARLKPSATRQRVLYTANVGDARIVLCRGGKALRLSYDHKGSDENEGRRIANAGGMILNNRVNGVLAVTRALGDAYMKDLVTGHPYTTETVIQPEHDEFIIIACDGVWDVCSDQEAVDFIRNVQDPVTASKMLVDHALGRFSTDNLSCMVVRLEKDATMQSLREKDTGVEHEKGAAKISEADKLVGETKQKIEDGTNPAIGVSASNSGRGHDPVRPEDSSDGFVPTTLDDSVAEEEPLAAGESDSPEATPGLEKGPAISGKVEEKGSDKQGDAKESTA